MIFYKIKINKMKNSIPTIVSLNKNENLVQVFPKDLERFHYEEVKDLQLIGKLY